MKRTKNNNRDPFGVSENWNIWNLLIKQPKKRNDLLADIDEIPQAKNRDGGSEFSSDNQQQ